MLPPGTSISEQSGAINRHMVPDSSEASPGRSFAAAQVLPIIAMPQLGKTSVMGLSHVIQCASPAQLGNAFMLLHTLMNQEQQQQQQQQQQRQPIYILLYDNVCDSGSEQSQPPQIPHYVMQCMLGSQQQQQQQLQPQQSRSFSDVRGPLVAKHSKALQSAQGSKHKKVRTKRSVKTKTTREPLRRPSEAHDATSALAYKQRVNHDPLAAATTTDRATHTPKSAKPAAVSEAVLQSGALLKINRIPPYTILMSKSISRRRVANSQSLGMQTDSSDAQFCDSFVQTEWSPQQLYLSQRQLSDQYMQTSSLASCSASAPALCKCLLKLNVNQSWRNFKAIIEQPPRSSNEPSSLAFGSSIATAKSVSFISYGTDEKSSADSEIFNQTERLS